MLTKRERENNFDMKFQESYSYKCKIEKQGHHFTAGTINQDSNYTRNVLQKWFRLAEKSCVTGNLRAIVVVIVPRFIYCTLEIQSNFGPCERALCVFVQIAIQILLLFIISFSNFAFTFRPIVTEFHEMTNLGRCKTGITANPQIDNPFYCFKLCSHFLLNVS